MTHTYNITGLTCSGCVAKAKNELLKIGEIIQADIQLKEPQATLTMQKHIPVETLQAALNNGGNYIITQINEERNNTIPVQKVKLWLEVYKPIIVVFAYITAITVSIEIAGGFFVWNSWMQNFMAAFFLVFSFFKMLDIKGFADSYSTYDIIAKRWSAWGYVYAFIELALGLAYLVRFNEMITNIATFVIMSISIAGVLQSVANKRKIQCACLGTVFNLPMSTVTILEDGLMIGMSAVMLIMLNA